MANHEVVPGSALTNGTAERRKSATSFSLPGFACSGTEKAHFVIAFSFSASRTCMRWKPTHDKNLVELTNGHLVRRPRYENRNVGRRTHSSTHLVSTHLVELRSICYCRSAMAVMHPANAASEKRAS